MINGFHSDDDFSDDSENDTWEALLATPDDEEPSNKYIGSSAKERFRKMYYNRVHTKIPRAPSARTMYLRELDRMGLPPESLGIIRKKSGSNLSLQ